ncbi:unnamed protein product [Boreogadus saida]
MANTNNVMKNQSAHPTDQRQQSLASGPRPLDGSKGGDDKASSTGSHAGDLMAVGGRSLKAPLRKRDTNLWHPTVALSTLSCREEIAAT